jgi:hypothetical protein
MMTEQNHFKIKYSKEGSSSFILIQFCNMKWINDGADLDWGDIDPGGAWSKASQREAILDASDSKYHDVCRTNLCAAETGPRDLFRTALLT